MSRSSQVFRPDVARPYNLHWRASLLEQSKQCTSPLTAGTRISYHHGDDVHHHLRSVSPSGARDYGTNVTYAVDLTPNANIVFTSDSIVDVLGWSPGDFVNHSYWEFFHPDELPLAKRKHGEGVAQDKAAILSYCRMLDRDGNYLGCENVFTVVYNVIVGCTSIYRRGLKSESK